MKGLELAEEYFRQVGAPMIEARFPFLKDRVAAGLVGDGSGCFGFDDDVSQDHDWGPGFCLWLTPADFEAHGSGLTEAVEALPPSFAGFQGRRESPLGAGRVGVFDIAAFYARFIGYSRPPQTLDEWRRIPEQNLAAATNGKIFTDPLGDFTRFREALLSFYPEDVRLKKIIVRCMTLGQAGQYNFMRSARRSEPVAALLAEARFIEAAVSLAFLLNRRFAPFYKWMHRGVKTLPILGQTLHGLLTDLVEIREDDLLESMYEKKSRVIEEICRAFLIELKRQDLTSIASDFLLDHGPEIQRRIQDPELRQMNIWVE